MLYQCDYTENKEHVMIRGSTVMGQLLTLILDSVVFSLSSLRFVPHLQFDHIDFRHLCAGHWMFCFSLLTETAAALQAPLDVTRRSCAVTLNIRRTSLQYCLAGLKRRRINPT